MDPTVTHSTLVRKMRTFADDVQRIRTRQGDATPQIPEHIVAPIPEDTPPPKPPVPAPATTPTVRTPPQNISVSVGSSKSAPLKRLSVDMPGNVPPENLPRLIDESTRLDGQLEGTIITDTRQRHWTLRKAFGNSLSALVDDTTGVLEAHIDPKAPQPSVSSSAHRTKLIEAARQKSALAPQDDRRVVVEKLRTFAQDVKNAGNRAYTTVHAPSKKPPQWSSTASPDAPSSLAQDISDVLAGSASTIKQGRPTIYPRTTVPPATLQPAKSLMKDVAPVATQGLPENVFEPKPPVESVLSAQVTHSRTPVRYGVPDVAPQVASAPVPVTPTTTIPTPEPILQPSTAPSAQEQDTARTEAIEALLRMRAEPEKTPSRDIPFTPPTFTEEKAGAVRTYREDAVQDVERHQRSVANIAAAETVHRAAHTPPAPHTAPSATSARPFVIAGVVMIAIMSIVGLGLFWYAQTHPQETIEAIRIPTFMAIDAQTPAVFSTNRATLLDTLHTAIRAGGSGITQIYPTQTGNVGSSAITTSEFMHVLDPRAPGSFIRNLSDEMMFGAYNGTDPFFVFRTVQFNAAFAGMIDWEPFISADLTPLFGEPVTRTDGQAPTFVDDTLQNTDVRILRDEGGAERILYAFVNKKTLVITTSSSALIELITRLR